MDALYWMFHGICHQMPERSLAAGGVVMPLCARCAGLFVALALAVPAYVMKARRGGGVPSGAFLAVTVAAAVAFGADGVANLDVVGLVKTPGYMRFAYGALLGFVLAPYMGSLLAMTLERGAGAPLAGGADTAKLVVAAALLAAINVAPTQALVVAESYAAGAGLVVFLGVAHTALLTLVLRGRVAVAAGISVVTVAGQIAMFAVLRGMTGL